ncbi:uncharacterized protein LOC110919539 [Helianthus annuus]|uniref:uncharacterized protein LOC110919539 n=1 Tax=Helianthus annuus TaxID=4232 RepID=UPI000B8FADF3|nr:uncharacterized protein LOC110919539 [Helianthus annuus]
MSSRAVKDIRVREKATAIEIRVIKQWISTSKVPGIKKNELCYQFVDRNGDGIEATADGDKIEYFDKIIRLQSCYRVTGYVCTKPRDYMATINHPASLIIGKKAKFVPIESADIPNIYFGFVSYEVLRGLIKVNKLLTDFIGRVDRNYLQPTGKISAVRKVVLRDERDHVGSGNIVAITATQVSNYYGSIQLEATYLTTVAINPEMPQTIKYTKRLRDLPPVDPNDEDDPIITVRELTIPDIAGKKTPNMLFRNDQTQHSTRFRCDAWIEKFDLNRGWFYVHCSTCDKTVYPEEDGSLMFVCKDDEDITPKFLYSVNAIIMDGTTPTEVTFFDEGMTALLKTSCEDLILKHGYTDPKSLPQQISDVIGIRKIMYVSVRREGHVVVTNVTDLAETCDAQGSSVGTLASAVPPTTPDPKVNINKRSHTDSPGKENTI